MNSNGIQGQSMSMLMQRFRFRRGLTFGIIIVAALLAFEIFNYSTTDYALADLLGDLKFLGVRWATILAIAFCGIDFAGIARLFTPEEGTDEPGEVWYLFGAWLLAATMNAMLTWWGVSLAILNHETLGSSVIERSTMLRIVPIFVAVLVWLIRVLIIGSFSVAGERLFSQGEQRLPVMTPKSFAIPAPTPTPARSLGSGSSRVPVSRPAASGAFRPASRPAPPPPPEQGSFPPRSERPERPEPGYPSRPEPTYHPISMSGSSKPGQNSQSSRPGTRR